MDFDISRWVMILAAVLLVPGLAFLIIVVIYVAFIGKQQEPAAAAAPRVCVTCGQTLLPEQSACPICAAKQA